MSGGLHGTVTLPPHPDMCDATVPAALVVRSGVGGEVEGGG